MSRWHIKIEGTDEGQMRELFDRIQNEYNLYDNCVIEEVSDEESFIEAEDRCEETGEIICERPKVIKNGNEKVQCSIRTKL
jgi:hypothetical protein